jgi:hypothetical protein
MAVTDNDGAYVHIRKVNMGEGSSSHEHGSCSSSELAFNVNNSCSMICGRYNL